VTGHLFLRRAASILVVVSLMLTSFTGILILAGGDQSKALTSNGGMNTEGDWYIGEDYSESTITVNGGWSISGSLIIRSGGVVVINGGALEFRQEYRGAADRDIHALIIEDGGKLVLNNATLTTDIRGKLDYTAVPSLGIMVRNGGIFEAYDSVIKASGHLVVDDSTFNLTRSAVLPPTEVSDYCDPDAFPAGEFDDSMVMLFMSSRVNLFDSAIVGIYEPGSENVASMFNHDYGFVEDINNASGNRKGASYLFYRMPSFVGAGDTTIGQALDNLITEDLRSYAVAAGEEMWLDGIDTAGLMFSALDGVKLQLNVRYTTDPGIDSGALNVYYQYRNGVATPLAMEFEATPIDPVTGVPNNVTKSAELPSMSAQDLYGLSIGLDNGNIDGSINIDKIWVSAEIALDTYRNVTVAGNTDFTAVDAYIGVDCSNDPAQHNQLVLMDSARAYLYGTYIDESEGNAVTPSGARVSPFTTISETFKAVAGAADDDTHELVGNLSSEDAVTYPVYPTEQMVLTDFTTSDIRGVLRGAELYVKYRSYPAETGGHQNGYIQWSIGESLPINTAITPSVATNNPTTEWFNLSHEVKDIADINDLNILFTNENASATVLFYDLWVNITISPTIYIYRWANITVQDNEGQLVSGVSVQSALNPTGNEEAYYYTPDGLRNLPLR